MASTYLIFQIGITGILRELRLPCSCSLAVSRQEVVCNHFPHS